MITYTFNREVKRHEWSALPRDFAPGDVVTRGSDSYGLCRDDMMIGEIETVPCTIDGSFVFTCPVKFLNNENGSPVRGDYWRARAHA